MDRREFVLTAGGAALATLSTGLRIPASAQQRAASFSRETVVQIARDLAAKGFERPPEVPEFFGRLGYDQYRDIQFRKELAVWLDEDRGFTLELLHAGFIYKTPVEVYVVEDGTAKPISYNSHLFKFGKGLEVTPTSEQPLFSGIRLSAPINSPGIFTEFTVFQGASYFRATGADQRYGISGRGLAVSTGQPEGEEFPFFRSFWVERPGPGAKTVVVHALLDSPSLTGAYSFRITPGHSTLMEVEATLFARTDIRHLGLAPLTSMFLFSSIEAPRFTDYRPAVHDSDVLAIAKRDGDWILRPLANPSSLQISSFAESRIRGFGLQQRTRSYSAFKDLEARYDLRPSLWVEPKGDWGDGQVELVEIPSDREANDNMVAFWRPRKVLARGDDLSYAYWLHWGPPLADERLATVTETRGGLTIDHARWLFIVDFAPPPNGPSRESPYFLGQKVKPQVLASKGALKNIVGQRNAVTGGYRASFELDVGGVDLSELRLVLLRDDAPISETWVYRWTP